ncbi:serine protease inhibitor swm-1-like [Leptodactylus fuscus]|uniref:serine protease inhibitor swm-1-like n=1 Tax=Leptodactylus fuscus TaxID=238119 RepID=UPI003F4EB274
MGAFMLSSVFLVAILQWKVESFVLPAPNCPENSTYGGYGTCYLTCGNVGTVDALGKACPLILLYTCKCNEGFLAQSGTSGETVQCVRPEECKATCGPNKHYEPYGSGCQPTCEDPIVPKICDKECSPKCVCNEGYVLSGNNCVKPTECKIAANNP